MDTKLSDQVDALLAEPLSNTELLTRLETLFHTHQAEVAALDGQWALTLYERSPSVFVGILNVYLPTNSPVFEQLLARSEREAEPLFRTLYARVGTPEYWNADIQWLIKTEPDSRQLVIRIQRRSGKWAAPTEETLIALYDRDPSQFRKNYKGDFAYGTGSVFNYLPGGKLERFRAFVRQRTPDLIYWAGLLAQFGTQAEFEAEAARWMREKPENLGEILNAIHTRYVDFKLDDGTVAALIQIYGSDIISKLLPFNSNLMQDAIKVSFETADNSTLLEQLGKLRQVNRRLFEQFADDWAMRLYERDLKFFSRFLLFNMSHIAALRDALLERAVRDGNDDFYRSLFARSPDNTRWNTAVRAALDTSPDMMTLIRQLDRLDVRAVERWNQTVFIEDDLAAELYRRSPTRFEDLIYRYVYTAHDYPLLLAAIKERGDMDFFARLFRKTATTSAWEKEMEVLLEADIPADRILEELERLKPANTKNVNPAILSKFLEKYGQAVLPFFENYLDWTHPKRLKSLLALDLDRGTLLRELQTIARRQPDEFAAKADIWAIPLYEKGTFFATFISRHLNRSRSREVGVELLKRAEADGNETLFREVYPRFYVNNEWAQDIARQIDTYRDDDALFAALDRRSNRWQTLPDDIAAALYTRNPDVFRAFVLEHVRSSRWQPQSYPRLARAAEQRGDTALEEQLDIQTNPRHKWEQSVLRLLKPMIPPDQLSERLRKLLPRETWDLSVDPIVPIVEHYGDAVVPFLMERRVPLHQWIRADSFRAALRSKLSPASFWQVIFRTSRTQEWYEAVASAARLRDDADFARELALLTPTVGGRGWTIKESVAVELYRRSPSLSTPFLRRFFTGASTELLARAEANGDTEFADYLLYRMLIEGVPLVWRAFPDPRWGGSRPDQAARDLLREIEQAITHRFDQWYIVNPADYVRRAAHILSLVQPFELGGGRAPGEHNALWVYLTTRHLDEWRRSPAAITELLESPNIFIQITGFDILSAGGIDAARRVLENLRIFRAFLFSGARRNAKHKALACLVAAAEVDADAKAIILPLLEEAAEYKARRSVGDDAAVALAKIKSVTSDE